MHATQIPTAVPFIALLLPTLAAITESDTAGSGFDRVEMSGYVLIGMNLVLGATMSRTVSAGCFRESISRRMMAMAMFGQLALLIASEVPFWLHAAPPSSFNAWGLILGWPLTYFATAVVEVSTWSFYREDLPDDASWRAKLRGAADWHAAMIAVGVALAAFNYWRKP
jgi:hypothetical protein